MIKKMYLALCVLPIVIIMTNDSLHTTGIAYKIIK